MEKRPPAVCYLAPRLIFRFALRCSFSAASQRFASFHDPFCFLRAESPLDPLKVPRRTLFSSFASCSRSDGLGQAKCPQKLFVSPHDFSCHINRDHYCM